MGNLGVGLGSFVDSFAKGYGIRSDMDDRKDRKAREARDNAYQDETRARQKELWSRDDKQYAREEQHRTNIEQINTDAKTEFQKNVDAGKAQPDQFDQFWTGYALPKMKNELMLQGDIAGATKLSEWGDTAAAKQGAKLFATGLTKSQTGDYEGALDDFLQAGQTKGYMDHGISLVSKEKILSPDRQLIGFRLTLKGDDGKQITQDITTDKIPELGAMWANPEMAWKSQMDARDRAAKKADDLDTYKQKKEIDNAPGVKSGNLRPKAIETLRKRFDGGVVGDEAKFDDMPGAQKEKLISDELALQTGEAAPGLGIQAEKPQRKVIVDNVTGRVIDPRDAAAQQVSRSAATAVDKVQNSPEMLQKAEAQRQAELRVQMAANRLNLGEDPRKIAADLESMGTPQAMWPPELIKALGGK